MATITLEAAKDAVMCKEKNGTFSGWNGKDNHIQVGATTNYKWRGVIKFNLGDTSNWTSITSATLKLTCYSDETYHESGTGTAMELKWARMTADWAEGTIDPGEGAATSQLDWHWDNRYDKWTLDSRQNVIQGTTGNDRYIDVTEIVTSWALYGKSNYGFILMNGTSETDISKAFLFYSTNTGTAANRPKLEIVYTTNTAPGVPTNLSPTGDEVVNTLTPSFSMTLNDTDANENITAYDIVVYQDDGTTVMWNSGKVSVVTYTNITSLTVAYGKYQADGTQAALPLVAGQYYKWKGRLYDKAGVTGSYPDLQRFRVNATPNTPTVTVTPTPLSDVPDDSPTISVTHSDPDPADSSMYGYTIVVEAETTAGAGDWAEEWNSGDIDVSGSPAATKAVTSGALTWGASCRVKARTQDSFGVWSSYSPWLAFTVHKASPPISLNPTGNETVSLTPTLTGARATTTDSITAYWLRVYTADLSTEKLTATRYTTGISSGNTFSNTYSGSALSAGTAYKWQARIESTIGGTSEWSSLQDMTTVDANTPTPVSPVGENAYSLTPTISCTRATVFNRVKFEIYPEASTTSNLGTAHYQSAVISSGITGAGPTTYSETYAGTALAWDTGYKIRFAVSSDGGSTWSSWSGLTWFKTNVAGLAILTSVAGDANNPAWVTDSTPDFVVTRSGTDTIDKVEISVWDAAGTVELWNSGLVDVANSTTGTVTYAGSGLSDGVTYSWTARYQSTLGPTGPYATRKQFRLNGFPLTPTQLFPPPDYKFADAETKTFQAFFADNDVATFGDYPTHWEIYIESDDEAPFDTEDITTSLVNGLNTRTWPGTALVSGNDYRWRTRFTDSKGQAGAYSAWNAFGVSTPPNGTLITPSNGSTVATVSPELTWSFTPTGEQNYFTIGIQETDDGGVTTGRLTTLPEVYSSELSYTIPAGYLHDKKFYNITLTVWNLDQLVDPTPSTVNVEVSLDAPYAITGVDSVADEFTSNITLTWAETTLKANHEFVSYRIYRRRPNVTEWEVVADVKPITNTTYKDYYAGNTIQYQYVVLAVTKKGGIELESPEDPDGGSYAFSAIENDNWTFIGEDRSPEHIYDLIVLDESHNRPIQQEVFETLGSSRKVIMRGFVLGHEGSITTLWRNTDVTAPEDEQLSINETVHGRRLVNYLTNNAGPHLLKSPFGDVWDSQFMSPEYRWLPTGHLEVTLEYVETGDTSRGII